MKIYLIYEKFYADYENGEDDAVFIECAYTNKRKAIKKTKELVKQKKAYQLYIDEQIKNKKNPFKNNNFVDFYSDKVNQEKKVSSIIMEEIKLVA